MTPPITQHEYFEQVEAIAEEYSKQPEGEQYDWLHQTIDNHEWIIYTWKAKHVMLWTDNEDAIWEESSLRGLSCHGGYTTRAAFYAMEADVQDALSTRHNL